MSELVKGGLIVGPSSSTDNAIVRYDGTSGRKVQDSTVLVNDTGDVVLENAGRIRNASSTQMNVGFFSDTGPGFELYKFSHATRPGEFSMVYGGAPSQGTMEFIQYDGTNFNRVLVVSTAQHIGLGTSAPQQRLHIVQANGAGDVMTLIQNNANTNGETTTLSFTDSTAPANYFARIQSRRVDANTGTLHIGRRQSAAIVDDININSTGQVGIGTSSHVSSLETAGSFGAAIATVTTNTTLTASHYTVLADATSGNITITLPAVSGTTRRIYVVKKIDSSANTVTIDGNASETIDGATTQVIGTQWQSYTIQSNGTAWYIV